MLNSYINYNVVLKLINSKFLYFKITNKRYFLKNINLFKIKKNIFFFLKKKNQNIFLNFFFLKLYYFLKGFKIKLSFGGRRFKFFINNNFFFFKMDTSKFLNVLLTKNMYIKKKKKYIQFFFYNINIFNIFKKIKNLKIPNKYTKKGIIFSILE